MGGKGPKRPNEDIIQQLLWGKGHGVECSRVEIGFTFTQPGKAHHLGSVMEQWPSPQWEKEAQISGLHYLYYRDG